jgi:hypothetical protein
MTTEASVDRAPHVTHHEGLFDADPNPSVVAALAP